jgi:hypothetical protein
MTHIIRTLVLGATLAFVSGNSASAQDTLAHPSFLEAAVFVLEGNTPTNDPPNGALSWVKIVDSNRIRVTTSHLRGPQLTFYFSVGDDSFPCTVFQLLATPPYTAKAWDFNLFSGPMLAKTSNYGMNNYMVTVPIGSGGYCYGNGKLFSNGTIGVEATGTKTCPVSSTVDMLGGSNLFLAPARRLVALQYIRDNFCPGLPDPPRTIIPY